VPKTDLIKALAACKQLGTQAGIKEILSDENISKVSIVGIGMKSHSGVAATMFKVLSDNRINIKMISTSEIKVSCVIEEKFTELAVRVLHNAFITEKQDDSK
ncbi:MAG: ACT domain-containing protein, partial [Mucispirillum sp.]|nr:ACT domain-containing protein [Mucispirillum sp.]